jgi:hypothetical protein
LSALKVGFGGFLWKIMSIKREIKRLELRFVEIGKSLADKS